LKTRAPVTFVSELRSKLQVGGPSAVVLNMMFIQQGMVEREDKTKNSELQLN